MTLTPRKTVYTLNRRKKLRKASKVPISKLQRSIWHLIKQIVRKSYPPTCYTCSATNLVGSNLQTGHMWAKASLGAYLKYDLRVLRIQCARCNLWENGRGADFYKNMLKEIGQEKMAELEKDRQITVKAYDHYASLIPKYQQILKELTK